MKGLETIGFFLNRVNFYFTGIQSRLQSGLYTSISIRTAKEIRKCNTNTPIDGKDFFVNLASKENFFVGKNEILSERFGDVTKKQAWHQEGYAVIDTQGIIDISIKDKIRDKVKAIIQEINLKLSLKKNFR